jgi:hypothetical protein
LNLNYQFHKNVVSIPKKWAGSKGNYPVGFFPAWLFLLAKFSQNRLSSISRATRFLIVSLQANLNRTKGF